MGNAHLKLLYKGWGSDVLRRVSANQFEIRILAAAFRNWTRDILNADLNINLDSFDSTLWNKFHQFMQTMKDIASSHNYDCRPLSDHTQVISTCFLTFHIRIRGDFGDNVRQILDRRTPKMRNIWGPKARNADVVESVTALISTEKAVFLVVAGVYCCCYVTYILSASGQTRGQLVMEVSFEVDLPYWTATLMFHLMASTAVALIVSQRCIANNGVLERMRLGAG